MASKLKDLDSRISDLGLLTTKYGDNDFYYSFILRITKYAGDQYYLDFKEGETKHSFREFSHLPVNSVSAYFSVQEFGGEYNGFSGKLGKQKLTLAVKGIEESIEELKKNLGRLTKERMKEELGGYKIELKEDAVSIALNEPMETLGKRIWDEIITQNHVLQFKGMSKDQIREYIPDEKDRKLIFDYSTLDRRIEEGETKIGDLEKFNAYHEAEVKSKLLPGNLKSLGDKIKRLRGESSEWENKWKNLFDEGKIYFLTEIERHHEHIPDDGRRSSFMRIPPMTSRELILKPMLKIK